MYIMANFLGSDEKELSTHNDLHTIVNSQEIKMKLEMVLISALL